MNERNGPPPTTIAAAAAACVGASASTNANVVLPCPRGRAVSGSPNRASRPRGWQTWADGIRSILVDRGAIRKLATVLQTNSGNPMNFPLVTTQGTATLRAEAAAITESEDTIRTFQLAGSEISTVIKTSREFLRDGARQPEPPAVDSNVAVGQPDTFLGKPLYTDPNIPVIGTGNRSVVFGDISAYTIRSVGGIEVQVLNELFALNGQVGLIVREYAEGNLLDLNAVKTLIHP